MNKTKDILINLISIPIGIISSIALYHISVFIFTSKAFGFIYRLFIKNYATQSPFEYVTSLILIIEIIIPIIIVQKICSKTKIKIRFGALLFSLYCIIFSIVTGINYFKLYLNDKYSFLFTSVMIIIGVIGFSIYSLIKSIKYNDEDDDILWN